MWGRIGPAPTPAEGSGSPAEEFARVAERLFANREGFYGKGRAAFLTKRWESEAADGYPRADTGIRLVRALLDEGRVDEAVRRADKLTALAKSHAGSLDRDVRVHLTRGLARLRQAEIANCVRRHNRDCCVYPLAGGGVHAEKTPAEEAAASYLAALTLRPDDLRARWLLNITRMAAGDWPDAVPERYRVPERAPGAADDFPRFRDVAVAAGLDRLSHAGGVVVDDLDGDGLLDLLFSCIYPTTSCALYVNRGDGTFEDRTAAAGFTDQPGALNLVAGDYDNDGDVDVFLLRGA